MAELKEVLGGGQTALWLDGLEYAERLLGNNAVPWLDTTACLAFLGKMQGLLGPSVQQLPLARLIDARLSSAPDLRAAMAARSRELFPLKTLLADEDLRHAVRELATAQCAGARGVPVVLSLPLPDALARQAYAAAHGDGASIDLEPEDVEDAASYLADFLRELAECGLSGLALVAEAGTTQVGDAEWQTLQPVLNVAQHYRWQTGLVLPPGAAWSGEVPGSLDFCIADAAPGSVPTFCWNSSAGPLRAWAIAVDSQPEAVLAQLKQMREA